MEDVDHIKDKSSDEKLVSADAETASVATLQQANDSSSKELIDTSASLEESIGASLGTFSREKLMAAGASESASAQTLQEGHVSSSEEELSNTASLEHQSITASPPSTPRDTSPPFSCEKIVAGVAEFARAQALQELELELDQFIKKERLGDSSSEDETTTTSLRPRAAQHNAIDGRNQRTVLHNVTDGTLSSVSSLGSKILSRCVPHCFYWYYIRMDRRGYFRIYPDRGGPFQSLQEAEDAIDCHHDGLWCQSWRDVQERAAAEGTYSSTRKVSEVDTYRYLVEALLDQYNEDNNLIGNLAHGLGEHTMMEQWIYEDHSYYYHYNFTTKKNEAADISLGGFTFFAEVSHKLGEHALEVNCCCKIEDDDNGWCYGCRNNGSHGMKHPKNSDTYTGGHLDVFLPWTLEEQSSSDDDDLC